MIVKITNLPVGIHALRFEKTVEELQLDEPFVDNLILDCKLDKSQHQIVVSCKLMVFTQLICDRCNVEFVKEYLSNFTLLYLFGKDIDNKDVNVKYLSPSDDKIDLTEDVLDYIKLAIPMKKICKEDCKGLCVKCGTILNQNKCDCHDDDTDPIWDPLLKLKDKLN